jgi:hypothetical protein
MSSSSVAAGGPAGPGVPGQEAAPAKDRTADVVITIIELLLLFGGGLLLSFAGLFLVFASDSCGSGGTECSTGLLAFGVALAAGGPWVPILGLGGWAVVRMVRGRSAWWVPLAAIPLACLVFALGAAVAFNAVG